jgi:hypothetical protein
MNARLFDNMNLSRLRRAPPAAVARSLLIPLAALLVFFLGAPTALAQSPTGTEIQFDGGEFFTCAVRADQTLHCWGYNGNGRAPETRDGSFTEVSAGSAHACGLWADGTPDCWGSNTIYLCDSMGICDDVDVGQARAPAGVVTQISAGAYHTCRLLPDGRADCWGFNANGEAADRAGPFSQVRASAYFTCAMGKNDGYVQCWGGNDHGKLKAPVEVRFTQIALGENHGCGILPDNNVRCWGGNTWGQAPDWRAGPFKQIAAGDLFTCGLKFDGTIDCWGYNYYKQRNAPAGAWTAFGLGDAHGCANNLATGAWQCWGRNHMGQAPRNPGLPTTEAPEADPPVVQIILDPDAPSGANGWYRSPVEVDPQASDESGIAELRCMLDPPYVPTSFDTLSPEPCAFLGGGVVSGEREHTFYAAAMDPWGNVSEVASISFKIDATAPKLLCPHVQPFLLGSGPYQVGISVSDFGSGVDEANSTLFGHVATDTVGPKSATFTAVDFAGNSATKECTYSVIYDFDGFYPPVYPEPALNAVKAGSAVPLKFSLGGDQGLDIIAPGYPASQPLDCATLTLIGEPVATDTAGGRGLSYNPASEQYTYVWKTEKAWAGTCRVLELRLVDETEQRVAFQFK